METVNSHGIPKAQVAADFSINPQDLGEQVSYSAGGTNFPQANVSDGSTVANRLKSYHIVTNTNIRFTGSVSPKMTVIEYFWDFGDGVTGYGPEVTHRYITASPETQIVLRVTLVDGRKIYTHQAANIVPGSAVILNAVPASKS